jgi:hypothetical protein
MPFWPSMGYPTDRPTFNYIDDVEISYETTFTGGAYLVLNCYELVTSHEFFEWIDADNPRKCSPTHRVTERVQRATRL